MNAAEEFQALKRERATFALFPKTSKTLFDLNAEAIRAGQIVIDREAERFTEARRGKPARVNPHDQ